MIPRLIKINAWYALACGAFSLIVAPMIVDNALSAMGIDPHRMIQDEGYLLAVSFVRTSGILLFAYAITLRLLLRQGFDLNDLRAFFTLFAVGLLLWGGLFFIVLFTHSGILASVTGLGLLEWLVMPAILLFTYKADDRWESVRPKD